MTTAANPPPAGGTYVTRDVCEALHGEQRDANARTWDELRGLRRLVIALVVGGHLFTGGLNLAGVGYWLQQHAAQPHPATLDMMAAVRAEVREDLKDLRREMRDLAASAARAGAPTSGTPPRPEGRGLLQGGAE